METWSNKALQRTAASHRSCNRHALWPPSLSLGRSPDKMTMIEVPPFDALQGETGPTGCFGALLTASAHGRAMDRFSKMRDEADSAVRDIFGRHLLERGRIIELDDVICEMWETGWDPKIGDVGLFVLHFGVLLTAAMLAVEGTVVVFRSETTLDHVSVWHRASGMEYFPLHKILKCLTHPDGDSTSQMYNDLKRRA